MRHRHRHTYIETILLDMMPVRIWQLRSVIVDPEHVQHLATWGRRYVRLKDDELALPQRMDEVCGIRISSTFPQYREILVR